MPLRGDREEPGVGGTWFENRYPGARVDSPSRTYTHTLRRRLRLPEPVLRAGREREVLQLGRRRVRRSGRHRVRHRGEGGDLGRRGQGLGDRRGRSRRAAGLARQRGDQRRRLPRPPERPRPRGPGDVRGAGVPHRTVASRPRPHRQAGRGHRERVHELSDGSRARRDGRAHLPLPAHAATGASRSPAIARRSRRRSTGSIATSPTSPTSPASGSAGCTGRTAWVPPSPPTPTSTTSTRVERGEQAGS